MILYYTSLAGCTSLTSVIMPSVTYIANYAFQSDTSLDCVISGAPSYELAQACYGCPLIGCPPFPLITCGNCSACGQIPRNITTPFNASIIEQYAFEYCTDLIAVSISS